MLTVEQMRKRAYDLMAEAIDLLDSSDCTMSAIHIARAIDLMPPMADGTVLAEREALNRSPLDSLRSEQISK